MAASNVSQPFSFTEMIVAERPYMATNSYYPHMGSVLTIYQPYPSGSEGRTSLLAGEREKFASCLSEQLEKLVPGIARSIDEIVLTRWGHALSIGKPLYFDRLAKLHALQTDAAYTLAHSSLFGFPGVESAIKAGTIAAGRAKKSAAKNGVLTR